LGLGEYAVMCIVISSEQIKSAECSHNHAFLSNEPPDPSPSTDTLFQRVVGVVHMTARGPLYAVSPLDGRYARYTEPLTEYASEAALMRARVEVEVEYLCALADLDATPIGLKTETRETLQELYRAFDAEDANAIKRLETEGYEGYSATNHDVKAVEYFIRLHLPEEGTQGPWVHFGLTSEDVNNLAHRLLLKPALTEVIVPKIRTVRDTLAEDAKRYRDVPMLARTHGQPATPTTYGKELAVYAARLGSTLGRLSAATDGLSGKLAGASGTYAAHHAAYPDVDWRAFSAEFVERIGLEHTRLSTQVNPCDDLAAVFDALRGVNNVLRDLDLDMWLYVSDRYLGQDAAAGETGSSTMPHKVNPIDFENSEGNLTKANADLTFLADYVTTSRLQRDLSDSTVKRNIGAALAHCLIGYEKATSGLSAVTPNEAVMREELEANPEVIGEAVQTILRREGDTDAYERIKALTRGQRASLSDFRDLFDELDVDESVREELHALTPAGYTGLGDKLVEELG
jgi:adenylosuccinate lyase